MTLAPLTAAFIIPALNEEEAIAGTIADVIAAAASVEQLVCVTGIYVVDNGSSDATASRAAAAGATVVAQPERGYGRACLTGVRAAEGAELVILMDGDRSDQPADLPGLLAPILAGQADFVIGSRVLGQAERGSLMPQQRFGNWLATRLILLLYGVRLTDIGPFRAIRRADLLSLDMTEMTYGWSVEMVVRAAQGQLRIREVPVDYRNRAGGDSKVSGNISDSIRAGGRILATIVRCRRKTLPRPSEGREACSGKG